MVTTGSQIIVLVFGITIVVLAAWGVYAPARLINLVTRAMDQNWGIYVGVLTRLLLGVALIIAAPGSLFPLLFQVLGWVAIVAAVALALMGRTMIRRLVAWFEQFSAAIVRLWLLFGIAFGGLLIYGVS
jgi:hypothetical protein